MFGVDHIYKPSEWGTRCHNTKAEELFVAGSAGPGKTEWLLGDVFPQIIMEHQRMHLPLGHPHRLEEGQSKGWALHLRRKLGMLDQTRARAARMFTALDPGARCADLTWTFTSGYHFQFGACWEPDAHIQFMSSEYTHVAFDELIQFEEEQYNQIIGRVRTTDPVLRQMLRRVSASNPAGKREGTRVKNPNWVRDYFVEPAPGGNVYLERELTRKDGSVEKRRRIYIPATLHDNPNKDFVRDYEVTLLALPKHIQRALLYGDWYSTPGSYFGDDWDASIHACEPFRVPKDWKHFRVMDWGYKTWGCVYWCAIDPDGTLYIHREFWFRMMKEDRVADRVVEIEIDMGLAKKGASKSSITGPADTQLWEERGDTGTSKAQRMAAKGVRWVRANKKSRGRNAMRLMARIRDHDDGKAPPGVIVFKSCRQMIRHLTSIMPDEKDPEVPDEDYVEDHAIDCALYAAEYADRTGKDRRSPAEEEEDDDVKPVVESADRGAYGYG